jgi:hypothetical protein
MVSLIILSCDTATTKGFSGITVRLDIFANGDNEHLLIVGENFMLIPNYLSSTYIHSWTSDPANTAVRCQWIGYQGFADIARRFVHLVRCFIRYTAAEACTIPTTATAYTTTTKAKTTSSPVRSINSCSSKRYCAREADCLRRKS